MLRVWRGSVRRRHRPKSKLCMHQMPFMQPDIHSLTSGQGWDLSLLSDTHKQASDLRSSSLSAFSIHWGPFYSTGPSPPRNITASSTGGPSAHGPEAHRAWRIAFWACLSRPIIVQYAAERRSLLSSTPPGAGAAKSPPTLVLPSTDPKISKQQAINIQTLRLRRAP